MEIKIVKMGINGEGIGYVQNKPTFVTGAFPDETVEIKIIKDNKTYQMKLSKVHMNYFAALVELEDKSENTVEIH